LAESTILYHIGDFFDGDIDISLQDGPEKTHFVNGKCDLRQNVVTIKSKLEQ